MTVNKIFVHSVSKHYQDVACETPLLYHFKKLEIEEFIQSNEEILL
jgi:hypothetical protein